MSNYFFIFGLILNVIFALVAVFHARHSIQFWPPKSRTSWQRHYVWWTVRILTICILIILVEDWGALHIPTGIRFYFALPIFIISSLIGTAGFIHLGWLNTHGVADKFIDKGIYKLSRNPQYFFYAICFISLGILSASPKASVLLVLLSVWYLLAPFPEERWLELQYGDKYLFYKQKVPRFL